MAAKSRSVQFAPKSIARHLMSCLFKTSTHVDQKSLQEEPSSLSIRLTGKIIPIPRDTQFAYVASIPRSGTWLCHYLIEHFCSAIDPGFTPDHQPGFKYYPAIRLAKMHVHSTCPGFKENYRGPLRAPWQELHIEELFDSDYVFAQENQEIFSPYANNNIRIVLLYRNPLDQAVSLYNHMKGHKSFSNFFLQYTNPADYLRKSGLDAYLKQYVTFAEFQRLFPENIYMLPYESLYEHTEENLANVLEFMNVPVCTPERQAAIKYAVEATSIDKMRTLERRIGHSLANDQCDPSASHIKNGARGLWRTHLDNDDIRFVESRLDLFGYTLNDFTI